MPATVLPQEKSNSSDVAVLSLPSSHSSHSSKATGRPRGPQLDRTPSSGKRARQEAWGCPEVLGIQELRVAEGAHLPHVPLCPALPCTGSAPRDQS